MDFIVLDIEEDEIPLILCRPFLTMDRALINVQQVKLTMKVEDNEATFVFKTVDFSLKL